MEKEEKNSFIEKLKKFFDSEEGQKSLEDYFGKINRAEFEQEKAVIKMHYKFQQEKDAFEKHLRGVVKESERRIAYFNEKSNGYQTITRGKYKGGYSELNGQPSFYILFAYFQKYGKDVMRWSRENFIGGAYKIGEYTFKVYHGQGSFHRLCKGKKTLIQF